MVTGQVGIFALGDAAHGFYEFKIREGADREALVRAVAGLRPPHTTVGGVNLVLGFRPDLWRAVDADGIPAGVRGFDAPLQGSGTYQMPATQSDLFVWYAAASYDIVFDLAKATVKELRDLAALEREITGWSYRHSRDLTGFEDGTENPNLFEAPEVALIDDGPGAGGSVLLFQKWQHRTAQFEALPVPDQERVIGRTKEDSVELDDADMPANSHVSRTKFLVDGEEQHIFRRNVPYGDVSAHGTVFVGFSKEQRRLQAMIEQMAGTDGGPRDALTNYSTPLTGAYYFIPSVQALARWAPVDDEPLVPTSN